MGGNIFFVEPAEQKKYWNPVSHALKAGLTGQRSDPKGNAQAYDKTAQSKRMGSIDGRKKKIYNVGIQPQIVEKKKIKDRADVAARQSLAKTELEETRAGQT